MSFAQPYRPSRRLAWLVLGLILALARPASAQSLAFGDLSGVVRDGNGRLVRDAEVRLTERVSGTLRSAVTGRDGRFRFGALVPARYDLGVEALGYRPSIHLALPVDAGAAATVTVVLNAAAAPVNAVDTVRSPAAAGSPMAWLHERGYPELTGGRRVLGDAATLSVIADANGIEGLPWRFTDVLLNGARSGAVGSNASTGAETATLGIPSRSVTNAEVGGQGYDVEISGTGVGVRASSLRGGGRTQSVGVIQGGTADLGAAFIVGGPLQPETAHAVFGVDYQQSEVARPAYFGETDLHGRAIAGIARDSFGIDFSPLLDNSARREERWGGFARLDWNLGDRYAVAINGSAGRRQTRDGGTTPGIGAGFGVSDVATMMQGSMSVIARLAPRLTQEFRFSGDVGRASGGAPTIPATSFAGRGLAFGTAGDASYVDERMSPRAAAILHTALGAHRVKFGYSLAMHRFTNRYTAGSSGGFRFGDSTDFATGTGAWRSVNAASASNAFTVRESAFFIQDSWQVADGLDLSLGLRFDGMRQPVSDIERNVDWLAVSGLDNRAVRASRSRVSPRANLRWELGVRREWLLEAGAGVFNDIPDRRDLGEALTLDRSAPVRYAAGSIGTWPNTPDSVVAPIVGQTLSLLGPEFEGPRTRRLSLGLQRRVGAWTAYMRGIYRHTDFLARRSDLNLPVAPIGHDQNGRPLYGRLQQAGSLVAVQSGTNRRFAGFDAVHALDASGYSEYAVATVGMEFLPAGSLSAGVYYAYSRTRDNLFGGASAVGSPFPGDGQVDDDWRDGRADTDAPHRVTAAAEWSPLATGGVRLGAVFRLQSGEPFTPGHRIGVDANGDGVAGNDPAMVDDALPGMDALISDWSCLRGLRGRFATRNACRGPSVMQLDLRAAFRVGGFWGGPVELTVEAIDVLAAERGRVDDALVLVDRSGTLTTNLLTGVTTVPLVVNTNFGELIADRSAGMLWRVGLRITR